MRQWKQINRMGRQIMTPDYVIQTDRFSLLFAYLSIFAGAAVAQVRADADAGAEGGQYYTTNERRPASEYV